MKNNQTVLDDFIILTEIGCDLSQHFGGLYVDDEKKTRSTHYLAKTIDNCFSILKLIPENKYSTENHKYLDTSSVLSLSRNLLETSNIFWYLIAEEISEFEFELRLDILKYHDYISMEQIFNQILFENESADYLNQKKNEYKMKIENNSNFQSLDKNSKNFILSGKKSTLLTQFEIAKKRGIDINDFKAYYKLMSVHTHSSPTAITNLVYTQGIDQGSNIDNIILSMIISYNSYFLADMIKTITELWDMKFAKVKSKQLVEKYSEL